MALYAIGDVQGCLDALQRLLDKLQFNPDRDRLWFCGDLVNRGPDSLGVLRTLRALGPAVNSVLGNHDLHALARQFESGKPKRGETLQALFAAPDRDELLDWLRHRPLLLHDDNSGWTVIHAGLLPQWSVEQARDCARELELVLQGNQAQFYFAHMYGNSPAQWSDELTGWDRLRVITNAFTRLRYCHPDGRMAFGHKGAPGSQPDGLLPWYAVPGRRTQHAKLVFGHWSAHGVQTMNTVCCLDTGCVWGGRLTAACLDTTPAELIQVTCRARPR